MLEYRKAAIADIPAMETLILQEGQNEWNYLPEGEIREHLRDIARGKTEAVLAEDDHQIIGFVSYVWGNVYPQYEPDDLKSRNHGYIAEGVVRRDSVGRGIGTHLLRMAVDDLTGKGYARIYAHRHEENKASARMLEKAGFVEVDTFYDPERRPHGSRRTTVCRLVKE